MRYDYLVRLFGGELKREYIERRYGKAFWLLMAPELLAMRRGRRDAPRHGRDPAHATRNVLLGADDGRVLQLGERGARADARAHPRGAGFLERGGESALERDRPAAAAERSRDHAGHARFAGARQRRALHARGDLGDLRAPPRQPVPAHRHRRRGAALERRGRRARLHHRQLHGPADRVSRRQHRLARRARHDERPRRRRRGAEIPQPRRAARGRARVRRAGADRGRHRAGGAGSGRRRGRRRHQGGAPRRGRRHLPEHERHRREESRRSTSASTASARATRCW